MKLTHLLKIVDKLYHETKGVIQYDTDGLPIFRREHFLNDWPSDVVTFEHRKNSLIAPENETVLCFYMGDKLIYRRFENYKKDLSIYKKYKGVVMPDITVTKDMDIELQETLMLANQIFGAYLVANGVKIIFNTRTGSSCTLQYLANIPRNIMCASGFLGCKSAKDTLTAAPYINKILRLMPQKLLLYGKRDSAVDEQLTTLGIEYRYFLDFHTRCKIRYTSERRAS